MISYKKQELINKSNMKKKLNCLNLILLPSYNSSQPSLISIYLINNIISTIKIEEFIQIFKLKQVFWCFSKESPFEKKKLHFVYVILKLNILSQKII